MVQAKQLVITLSLLFFVGCATLQPRTDYDYERVFSNWPFQLETLQNGLRVLFLKDADSPVVSYSTWFEVGSSFEKEGSTGLAHLFEHLMFKGTKKFPNKPFFRLVEAKGGTVNAFTQKDATVYYQVIPKHLLHDVIRLEADRLSNLDFTEKELAAEKKVVFQERQLRIESSVQAQAYEKLNEMLFPGHPYRRPVIGYPDDLARLTLHQCKAFFKNYYSPEKALIVVAGNFEVGETLDWIKQHYGRLNRAESEPERLFPVTPLSGTRIETVHHEVSAESALIGYQLPSMYSSDAEAIAMASWYLFSLASSPMVQRLVRESQVATSVQGSASFEKHGGMFLVSIDMRKGISVENGIRLFDETLASMSRKRISPDTLQDMKNKMLYSLLNEGKNAVGVADWFGSGVFYWKNPHHMKEVFKKYQDITPEQIHAAIERHLNGKNRVVVKVVR